MTTSYHLTGRAPGPRAVGRARAGCLRLGRVAVAVAGEVPGRRAGARRRPWWTTDRNAFTTGIAGRTGVEAPLGEVQPFEEFWDPALLIAEETPALGRNRLVVRALPRPTPRPSGLDFILLEWPGGDQHELVVDLELGIVLRLTSFWRGQELVREQVVELKVDPVISGNFFLDRGAR